MTREAAFAFVAANGPKMTVALNVITGKQQPLGVLEAEAKRTQNNGQAGGQEQAVTGVAAARTTPVLSSASPETLCGQYGMRAPDDWHRCTKLTGHDGPCRCHCGAMFNESTAIADSTEPGEPFDHNEPVF